ncbi:redoxin domain-containing protein [Methanolobus sp. ZRKC3]|uniref:redoxin domain-containing protein n=1 Tax=Methanolobus sp. ZRKC3 TaxID=3125786 RepID=UPI003873C3AF
MPLIGDDVPVFKARSTMGVINFPEDYRRKWVIFFSHPGDFTPVCTTEFIKCATMQEGLRELNTELLGLSVDSVHSHIAWISAIRDKVEYRGMKGVDVMFPIIDDVSLEISRKYGMIHPNAHYSPDELLEKFERSHGKLEVPQFSTETVRATFIIDPMAKVRAILYYPLSNGRSMGEIKRLLMALQKSDREDVFTPENWQPGEDVIVPAPDTWPHAKEIVCSAEKTKCFDWFLCLKKDGPE